MHSMQLMAAFQKVRKDSEWNQTCPVHSWSPCKTADCLHGYFDVGCRFCGGWRRYRAVRVRGGVHNISLVPVPACVWLIGTLISSIWSCPNRRQHQRANPKYQRLCFDLAPQQHDLNPTVSFESPTVTARRLENLTSAGLQHASLYTLTGMQSGGNLKDNAMATFSLGRPPPKRSTKRDAISSSLPFSIFETLIHKVF